MFSKSISVFAIAAVMATGPATKASADAGDFVAGALIGGVVGHALTKENQRKKATTQRSTTRTYNTLPSTQEGREIQASLNYFGFDAGAVDGQLGRKSRNAVSNYQGYLGYPVTGVLSPFEQNLLISSYNRAQAGGYATNQQAAALPDGTRGLLRVYRDEMAGGGTTTASVPEPAPTGTLAAVAEPAPSAPALPSFMNDGAPQKSLAAHCNQVSLLTNSNGGFTTEAKMTDANFALNEQFCLARTYAIAEGQELAAKVSGYTTQEITQQCEGFGPALQAQVDALSYDSEDAVTRDVGAFAMSTGMAPSQLKGTARICLGVGYRTDNMEVALASALILYTMGEKVYGELMGHHLAQGYGTTQDPTLALQWYEKSWEAHNAGQKAAFAPGQPERNTLIHKAAMQVGGVGDQAGSSVTPTAALPTFSVSD